MDKNNKKFFEVFTDFQCFILAHMSKADYNGVTATHYNIIELLYRKGKMNGKELARNLGVSPPAISRQLKFLIENNLLTQEQDSLDRRTFYLNATKKGKLLIDGSEGFRKNVTMQIGSILSVNELQNLTSLLAKVMKNLKDD
jgi:DNA-binding MarR family transcriptional regulator